MSSLSWQRSLEQIALTSALSQGRILGLTSIREGAGVSLICENLARTIAASGVRTLFLDLSPPLTMSHGEVNTNGAFRYNIEESGVGYDKMVISDWRAASGTGVTTQLKDILNGEHAGYARVIVDFPPVLTAADDRLNVISVAGICDKLLLVCKIGQDTRADLASAMSLISGSGLDVSGVIANEESEVNVREELLKFWKRGKTIFRRQTS